MGTLVIVAWAWSGTPRARAKPDHGLLRRPHHPRAGSKDPTIVVLTDRNDLDDQLFGVFSQCQELLRQPPVQAESRAHLRELLSVAAGGVVFTTIHKFFPEEKGDRHPPYLSAATSWS